MRRCGIGPHRELERLTRTVLVAGVAYSLKSMLQREQLCNEIGALAIYLVVVY